MDNTWFYTLSTIVQGLAALFGLSATFLVFKLQTLNTELRNLREIAISTLSALEDLSATRYLNLSLLEVSEKFKNRVARVDPDLHNLDQNQIDALHDVELDQARIRIGRDGKTYRQYFYYNMRDRSMTLDSKVHYRLKLFLWSLITGVLMTGTMLLALLLLSGVFPHTFVFGPYSINFFGVSVFGAGISIFAALVTGVYAIVGDRF